MKTRPLLLGLGLLVGACGIPEEVHNQALKDIEKCKQDLANTQNDAARATAELAEERSRLTSVEGERGNLAKNLSATQKELLELRKAREAAEKRNAQFKALLDKLRAMIDSGKLAVEVRNGKMVVKLSDKILFDTGKAELKTDGEKALAEVASALKDIGDRDFLVAGHTDAKPVKGGKFKSNWQLSAARALTVVQFLQKQGVDPKHLAAAGYSEFDPVGDNATEEGAAQNRRIEIVLMPNVSELPQMESTPPQQPPHS